MRCEDDRRRSAPGGGVRGGTGTERRAVDVEDVNKQSHLHFPDEKTRQTVVGELRKILTRLNAEITQLRNERRELRIQLELRGIKPPRSRRGSR